MSGQQFKLVASYLGLHWLIRQVCPSIGSILYYFIVAFDFEVSQVEWDKIKYFKLYILLHFIQSCPMLVFELVGIHTVIIQNKLNTLENLKFIIIEIMEIS